MMTDDKSNNNNNINSARTIGKDPTDQHLTNRFNNFIH
jgi:hypothetical protein